VIQFQKYTSLKYSAHLGLLQRTRLPGLASWAITESVPGNRVYGSRAANQ